MAPFDPYHKWLGIPPDQQPVSHYRLLGIEEFEIDADVIETAAERQTLLLRTFQTGPNSELAEQLLNEISAARVCLLTAEDKTRYDQHLQSGSGDLAAGAVERVMPRQEKARPLANKDQMPTQVEPPEPIETPGSSTKESDWTFAAVKLPDDKDRRLVEPEELTANDDDPLTYSPDQWAPTEKEAAAQRHRAAKSQQPFWKEPWAVPAAAGGVVAVLLLLMLLTSDGDDSKPKEKPKSGSSAQVERNTSESNPESKSEPNLGSTVNPETRIEGGRILLGHTAIVRGVAYSPNGKWLATGGSDATIRVWDVLEGTHVMTLEGHTGVIRSVAFSPDGKRLVSGAGHEDQDYTARVWDLASRQVVATQSGHRHRVMSAVFSPDGRKIASGSADGEIKLWDSSTGRETKSWKTETSGLASIAFSPDGASIASASWYAEEMNATVKLWYAGTGAELRSFSGKSNRAFAVAFSPTGRWVAASKQDHTIKVWDALEGTKVMTLEGHTDSVHGVAFGPLGRQIASASYDQSVRVWNVATGEMVHVFNGHDGRVCNVAFSPDGQQLASVGVDKTVRLWDISRFTP